MRLKEFINRTGTDVTQADRARLDLIDLLYRDDYHDRESKAKDRIEIILAKYRNGPIGTEKLVFLKEYGKFLDLVE